MAFGRKIQGSLRSAVEKRSGGEGVSLVANLDTQGHGRRLVPSEQVSETQAVLPARCRHCEQALAQQLERVATTGEIYRRQIVELPEIKAQVTEYQFHEVVCPCCGNKNRAAVPPELQRQTGPRLTALVTYLTVVCRTPRRVVQEFLETFAIPEFHDLVKGLFEHPSSQSAGIVKPKEPSTRAYGRPMALRSASR